MFINVIPEVNNNYFNNSGIYLLFWRSQLIQFYRKGGRRVVREWLGLRNCSSH